MNNKNQVGKFENIIFTIISSKFLRLIVILLTFIALAGSVMMFPTKLVKAKMLPGKSTNTFSIYVDTPMGSSISETKKVTNCISSILEKEKNIINISIYLGEGSPLNYAGLVKGSGMKQGEQFAEIVINLTDKNSREEKSFLMVKRLRPILNNKCSNLIKNTNIKMIEMPAGPPTLASIVVEVYGKDNTKVIDLSKKVASILKKTDGLVDIDVMADEIYKKYELIPLKDKISRSGLTVEQINKILYLAFEGMNVAIKNSIKLNNQVPIFVSLDKASQTIDKNSIDYLENRLSSLSLMNQKGLMIPLTEIVEIKEIFSKPTIFHKNLKTMVNVVAETDMLSQVYPLLKAREKMIKEFSKKYFVTKVAGITTYMFDLILKDRKTGDKYLLRWDGEMKVTLDTFRDLGAAFIAALILIFILLVIYYKSFSISAIILGGSFLSIIGVIIGHWIIDIITTQTFFLTATSLIGFIALMGISSRNSLLLIDFAIDLIKNKKIEQNRAIAISSATRAKPIMLTAIAIILGSALLSSDPVFGGLGISLIFGTIIAVIISLVFIPVLLTNSKLNY